MLQTLISLIFYMVFMIYIFIGIYGLTLNGNERLNCVFFFLCLSFSIWALAFAISNSSNAYAEVLFWRRAASLGWGGAFSFIVHFTLILTENINILRKKWVYPAIYLPAVVSVFVFGLYNRIANKQYNLVQTAAGWGNIPLNNLWDIYYNCYYLLFSLVTCILLINWNRKANSTINKKYAKYLLISFCASIALGSLTEMVANSYLNIKIPSLAPIIILIPVTTIFYIIHKYRLMQSEHKGYTLEGIILSDDKRAMFFRSIAAVFYIGSILNLLHYFFYPTQLTSIMLFSTILVFMAAIILIIPFSRHPTTTQDNLLIIIMTISIPVIIFRFLEDYASNIVWPIPLIFMMITIIFNNKKMFSIIAGISILTGILSWIRVPRLEVSVGTLDYSARIILYIMGIILSGYINKLYISRLKENEKQVEFQKMISDISTDFVTVTSSNLDEKIKGLLEKSGNYVVADRSYLGLFSEEQEIIHFTHEWLGHGIKSVVENTQGLHATPFAWSSNQLLENKIVFIPEIEGLPAEAKMEKEVLEREEIKSLIYIPITKRDKVIGFIGFDQIKEQKGWHIDDNDLLKVLANILADAITKVEVEKNINYLAYYDALTGLPNRTLFSNRLDQAVHLARRTEKLVGVMFIDLDSFKAVNDTLGHDCGDKLLKQVADRLSSCVNKYDTVARFGGDEFLIMIPQASGVGEIEEAANKVMKIFEKPILVNEQEFFITASGGIALFPVDGEEINVLIKNADLAMYVAKGNGKSQYAFCSSGMKDDILQKMMLTNSLYRALEKKELELYYQPQVSIRTGEIIGMEALLRWNHPELGIIPPNIFIPIAEQTGLINGIGEWVLKTACRQNKLWQDMGFKPVRIAVNISLEQFRSGDIMQIVRGCLEETGLQPQYLELEVTEGIAMKEANYIIKALHELKSMDVAISIDDFGTEYSSLSRLKDLPVDRLKIDMQFIQGISVNSKDESIISVMIHLARSLGLKVIAEGVETEVQLDFLAQEACDGVQGYYYYKPMRSEEVESSLLKPGNGGLAEAAISNE